MARTSVKKTENAEMKKPIATTKSEEVNVETIDVTEPIENNIDTGLTSAQVQKRIEAGQVNNYVAKKGKSIGRIFFDNIFTFFNMLYLVITVMLVLAHSWTDMFYLLVVIPNLIIGIYQEIKAIANEITTKPIILNNKFSVFNISDLGFSYFLACLVSF